jgi:hypothetical protein
VIRTIKDPVTQMASFKAGEIDFIADFSADHVDTIRGAEPARPDHDRERDDADGRDDGKPMSKDRALCPYESGQGEGDARRGRLRPAEAALLRADDQPRNSVRRL